MSFTTQDYTTVIGLLADNSSGDISPADVRDLYGNSVDGYGAIKSSAGATVSGTGLAVELDNTQITMTTAITASGITANLVANSLVVPVDGIYMAGVYGSFSQINSGVSTWTLSVAQNGSSPAWNARFRVDGTHTTAVFAGYAIPMSLNSLDYVSATLTGSNTQDVYIEDLLLTIMRIK